MVLRYRHTLIEDPARQRAWVELEDAVLRLPDTHHENFTSHTEGPYQPTMGFQATTAAGLHLDHDQAPREVSDPVFDRLSASVVWSWRPLN